MLEGAGLDLVLCFNPTSSWVVAGSWHERLRNAYRTAAGRRLGAEARLVRQAGAEVALLQPGPEDILAMGNNYMRVANLDHVTDVARDSIARQLEQSHPQVVDALRTRSATHLPRRQRILARTLGRLVGQRRPGPRPGLAKGTLQLH